ncbi:DUF4360 domain-containing protein [Actinomadura decatromicini]|uniref:DUF4360 domain-containing protein n=1 Tax=Actinomadura decatromicini TaxID=2604572 RepID=A0A5D3FN83_9ACTN|nr:DUF4360 domain-containing protein [Actinomadura decatromicini]TYK49478.1 DUF4360 domain-containing protein [Actinomadura decatromicini]
MRTGIAIVAAALTLTATPSASAAAAPRGPDAMTIKIAQSGGSGCPFDTTTVAVSDDLTAFSVAYSDYTAQAGGSSLPVQSRKYCRLALRVFVPQNVTYGIVATDHHGYASLLDGAKATHSAGAYFHGQPSRPITHDLTGPYADNWQFTDQSDLGNFLWKPCGQDPTFDINTELRVDQGTADPSKLNLITMEAADSTIRTTYHLTWKPCP